MFVSSSCCESLGTFLGSINTGIESEADISSLPSIFEVKV